MPHHTRLNPKNANQIGPTAPDSTTLPEFTFHHGHVDQVFNVPLDVEFTKVSPKPIKALIAVGAV